MTLKLIKTRYGGTCAKCNREIKPDWEIYFDTESTGEAKKIYCKPCGLKVLNGESSQQEPLIPDNLPETARLEDISIKIDHINTFISVLAMDIKRFSDKIEALVKDYDGLLDYFAQDLAKKSETETAKNGSEFLKKIDKFNPDIVTLDVMMPGLTTKEILKKLKNKKSNPKIILLTVLRYTESEKNNIMKLGNIVDYITKPFDIDVLTDCINKHL